MADLSLFVEFKTRLVLVSLHEKLGSNAMLLSLRETIPMEQSRSVTEVECNQPDYSLP